MANRLSANLSNKVALLEAGPPDNSFLIHTPALLGVLVGQNKIFNWCFDTTPQKHLKVFFMIFLKIDSTLPSFLMTKKLKNRRLFQPRGKTLGGSSSINAMIYIRGQHEDYDNWNVPGWAWKDIKNDFLNTQNQQNMVF